MKKCLFKIFAGSILVVVLAAGAGWGIGEARSLGRGSEKVEVLIGFEGRPGLAARALIKSHGGEVTKELSQINVLLVSLPLQAAEQAVETWSRRPQISFVEENGTMHAHSQTVPWGIGRIGAPEAHKTSTGSGVSIAILDTGIDVRHEDLTVAGGYAAVNCRPGPRCAAPWDDDHGHGTHVAGTAAALNNNVGVLGVAPDVSLYAVKVLDRQGAGTWDGVAEGIIWAADQGIEVINMSLGGGHSETVESAVIYAHGKGSLLVSSAGNSGPDENTVGYPAAYPQVIAVSAIDQYDNIASWSSRGEQVEFAAPGVSIYSTLPGNSYGTYSGTSMASPHVAGAAALVWATNPELTNDEVRGMLQETAEWLEGLSGTEQGFGLVNAVAAVGVEPSATGNIEGTVKGEDNAAITGATVVVEGTSLSVLTDGNGDYLLENVPAGEQQITASAEGYYSKTAAVTVEGSITVEQNFVLEVIPPAPTYTVSGAVTDTQGNALEGAAVVIEGTELSAVTGSNGAYSISEVEEGTYNITASKYGYVSKTEIVTVNSGMSVDFILTEITESTGPVIDKFELANTSNPAWARVTVEWAVSSDIGLASLETEMILDGKVVDSKTSSLSGSTASGTHELRVRNGHNKTYEIVLTVTDVGGNRTSDAKNISL